MAFQANTIKPPIEYVYHFPMHLQFILHEGKNVLKTSLENEYFLISFIVFRLTVSRIRVQC